MNSAKRLELIPLMGLPEIHAGNDLPVLLLAALNETRCTLEAADVLVLAQKIVSKAEGRRVCLADVSPTARAIDLSQVCGKDPRLVELVLQESSAVLRCAKDVLIVRHRLGFTVANAGIDLDDDN